MRDKKMGHIAIPEDVNVWPHEFKTAQTLAKNGYDVVFVRKSNREREHSADAYIDGERWEFKAPNAKHTGTILKNLKEARWQSTNVVLDSRRMKGVSDEAILREVRQRAGEVLGIEHLKYVSKTGKLLDIQ